MTAPSRGGSPDADALAALTGRPRVQKVAPVDPVLGLVRPPSVPVGAAGPQTQEQARQAYAAAGVEAPAALTAAAEPGGPPPERKSKQGFYGYPSTMERIRSAWFHTQSTEDGQPSISELIVAATLGEGPTVEELERKHNGGNPFPPVPPGKVRHSRRT